MHLIIATASGITWPGTEIVGWVAKEILHLIYAGGDIILKLMNEFMTACCNGGLTVIDDIVQEGGFMNNAQTIALNQDALNVAIIAQYLSACIVNPTIFFNGLNAVVITAICSCVIRFVLKLWAIAWSGQ